MAGEATTYSTADLAHEAIGMKRRENEERQRAGKPRPIWDPSYTLRLHYRGVSLIVTERVPVGETDYEPREHTMAI